MVWFLLINEKHPQQFSRQTWLSEITVGCLISLTVAALIIKSITRSCNSPLHLINMGKMIADSAGKGILC